MRVIADVRGHTKLSAAKPIKVPFGGFECPSCGYKSWCLWVLHKGFRAYAWCPKCATYFIQRNAWAYGLLVGGVATALAGLLGFVALEIWAYEVQPSLLLSVSGGIAVLIVLLLMPQFAKWTIRYEHAGPQCPLTARC